MRFRSKKTTVIVGVVIIAILWCWSEGIGIAWVPIEVRLPGARKKVDPERRYFGFWRNEKKLDITDVAVINGTFSLNTWVAVGMYVIKDGEVDEAGESSLGQTPNAIGSAIWETLNITVALGETKDMNRTTTRLGCRGMSRGGGSGGEIEHSIARRFERSYPGKLRHHSTYLLYVYGDAEPPKDRETTVESLAKANVGNFVVLTVQLL